MKRVRLIMVLLFLLPSMALAQSEGAEGDKDDSSGLVRRDPLRESVAEAIRKGSGHLYGACANIP